jgi:hypothetical protein
LVQAAREAASDDADLETALLAVVQRWRDAPAPTDARPDGGGAR